MKNDFFTKNRVKTALRVGLVMCIFAERRVRNTLPGRKSVFDQTFVKSLVNSLRVKTALPGRKSVFDQTFVKSLVNSLRVKTALPGRKSVFDQTFVKSLVNSLRVKTALPGGGLAIYFFVEENGVQNDWTI
jgi:hypothetical protein